MSDDHSSAMTPEQRSKAAAALERLGMKACDVCGCDTFEVCDIIEAPTWGRPPGASRPKVPLLLTLCTRCGYAEMFSAVVLGLVEPAEERGGEEGGPR
jgi:hypothetical protein